MFLGGNLNTEIVHIYIQPLGVIINLSAVQKLRESQTEVGLS